MSAGKFSADEIHALIEKLRANPESEEALRNYREARRAAVEETARDMREAQQEGNSYQLWLSVHVTAEQLDHLLCPTNELMPELVARDLADTTREICYHNMVELTGVGEPKS